jgi:hypothetical protein
LRNCRSGKCGGGRDACAGGGGAFQKQATIHIHPPPGLFFPYAASACKRTGKVARKARMFKTPVAESMALQELIDAAAGIPVYPADNVSNSALCVQGKSP